MKAWASIVRSVLLQLHGFFSVASTPSAFQPCTNKQLATLDALIGERFPEFNISTCNSHYFPNSSYLPKLQIVGTISFDGMDFNVELSFSFSYQGDSIGTIDYGRVQNVGDIAAVVRAIASQAPGITQYLNDPAFTYRLFRYSFNGVSAEHIFSLGEDNESVAITLTTGTQPFNSVAPGATRSIELEARGINDQLNLYVGRSFRPTEPHPDGFPVYEVTQLNEFPASINLSDLPSSNYLTVEPIDKETGMVESEDAGMGSQEQPVATVKPLIILMLLAAAATGIAIVKIVR